DHDDQGAAEAQSTSFRSRGARSAAIQSMPVRRARRNHARRDARDRAAGRGAKLMAAVSDKPEHRSGSLSVVQRAAGAFETFVKITADGSVTAYNGHVDLGT